VVRRAPSPDARSRLRVRLSGLRREYLAVAFLLFFRRRFDVLRTFALCFLLVNVLGFITYFVYRWRLPGT